MPSGFNHPLPGKFAASRAGVKKPADPARPVGFSGELRDLSVSRDLSLWNGRDELHDLFRKVSAAVHSKTRVILNDGRHEIEQRNDEKTGQG